MFSGYFNRSGCFRLGLLAVGMGLVLLPQRAPANMAAPSFVGSPGLSAAAGKPPADDLTVHRETLEFAISETASTVNAEYHVEAARAGVLAIRFISPKTSDHMRAWVNDVEQAVVIGRFGGPLPPLDDSYERAGFTPESRYPDLSLPQQRGLYLVTLKPFDQLHETQFNAPVVAGMNRIKVTYSQDFGAHWTPRGYFRDPQIRRVYPYELWPLREWRRSDDFHLELQVKVTFPKQGFLSRTFGKAAPWTLFVFKSPFHQGIEKFFQETLFAFSPPDSQKLLAEPVTGQPRGGEMTFSHRLGSDFPDRLYIVLEEQMD